MSHATDQLWQNATNWCPGMKTGWSESYKSQKSFFFFSFFKEKAEKLLKKNIDYLETGNSEWIPSFWGISSFKFIQLPPALSTSEQLQRGSLKFNALLKGSWTIHFSHPDFPARHRDVCACACVCVTSRKCPAPDLLQVGIQCPRVRL